MHTRHPGAKGAEMIILVKRLGLYDLDMTGAVEDMQVLMRVLTDREIRVTHSRILEAMESGTIEIAIANAEEESSERSRVVGMATLVCVGTLTGKKGLVEDVVVLPEFQGKGIASRLIGNLKLHAGGWRLNSLELTSHPSRIEANRLYAKLGFEQRETNVWRLAL